MNRTQVQEMFVTVGLLMPPWDRKMFLKIFIDPNVPLPVTRDFVAILQKNSPGLCQMHKVCSSIYGDHFGSTCGCRSLLLLFWFQKQWNLLDKYLGLDSTCIRIFCLKRVKNSPSRTVFQLFLLAHTYPFLFQNQHLIIGISPSLINEGVSHQALLCNLRGLACGPPVTRFTPHFSRPAGRKENLSRILK